MAHTLGCWVIQKAIAQPLAFKAVDSIAGFIFIAMQDFAATEVLAWEAFRTSTLTYLANRPTEFHRAGGNKDDLEPLSLDNENFRRLLQSLGAEGITEDLTQPWPDETALKVPALPVREHRAP
jgi:predicted alpha/beta hydrolase family esterase